MSNNISFLLDKLSSFHYVMRRIRKRQNPIQPTVAAMRISNEHRFVEGFHSQYPFKESDIILTYPADPRNGAREEYIIEQAPLLKGTVETARNVSTYAAEHGAVSLKKNVTGTLVDVYA